MTQIPTVVEELLGAAAVFFLIGLFYRPQVFDAAASVLPLLRKLVVGLLTLILWCVKQAFNWGLTVALLLGIVWLAMVVLKFLWRHA